MYRSQSPVQDASGDLTVTYPACTISAFLQGLLQVAYLVATNKILNTKQNKGILAWFLNDTHMAELFKYVWGRKKHGWLLLAQLLSEIRVKSFQLSRRGTYSSNCILPTFITVKLLRQRNATPIFLPLRNIFLNKMLSLF